MTMSASQPGWMPLRAQGERVARGHRTSIRAIEKWKSLAARFRPHYREAQLNGAIPPQARMESPTSHSFISGGQGE